MKLNKITLPAKIKEHYIKSDIIKIIKNSPWEIIVYTRELRGDFDYWILTDDGKWELSIY